MEAWGRVSVVGRLGGGNRNEVLEIRLGGERLVARRGRRSPAALAWELDLLEFLSARGFVVPAVVPALDGRRSVEGMVVQRWLSGRPPESADWPAVAAELSRLHALTADWPQRPDFASTAALLTEDRGGDVDLSVMPAEAVVACRAAWQALSPACAVIHGDPGAPNIRITPAGVGFLDWDEARVDHPDLDLADLPIPALPEPRLSAARRAVDAWEAACGWQWEPAYARTRLARLSPPR
jgi:Ser/Thr protein kinase RdoA (MazF antagonist)